jgi:hypothetical protein
MMSKSKPKYKGNLSEEEIVATIENVSNRLASKYRFGYHGVDDMKQQAAQFAIEGLAKYDGKRPLENFLWTHVRNQLFNYKRDHFRRPDKPCFTCPFYDKHCEVSLNQCEKYEDKMECSLYTNWVNRNNSKQNIMQPADIGNVRDEDEENMRIGDHTDEVERKELWTLIDKHLDIKLRADYIKMRNSIKIPKQKRIKVEQAILLIMEEHYDG